MRLQTIVDHLVISCPAFRQVAVLTDITEIDAADSDTPAAFVLWTADGVADSTGAGALVSQARTRRFAVLIVGLTPQSDGEPVEDARQEVMAALIGWSPPGANPPIQITYAGGEADAISGGLLRWRDTYQFTDYLRFVR